MAETTPSSERTVAAIAVKAGRSYFTVDRVVGELGIKGVEVDLWYAFFAPSKTQPAVLSRLNSEIASILRLPDVRDLLGKAGMDAAASTPDELSRLVGKDYPRWGEVIRRNGISAE